jgi:hypothetical protein
MNEIDWLTGTDAGAMLDYLEGKVSARKLRLFACACVRRYWPNLRAARGPREAVELAERSADGQAGEADMEQARQRAEQWTIDLPLFEEYAYRAAAATLIEDALEAARTVRDHMRQHVIREAAYEVIPGQDEAQINAEAAAAESRAQCELLRDIIGNPFRPFHIDPCWLRWNNSAVAALVQVISENGQYGDLPYLGDALEDAGCSDDSLLRHCRQTGGHVRGCCVVDLLLGRD